MSLSRVLRVATMFGAMFLVVVVIAARVRPVPAAAGADAGRTSQASTPSTAAIATTAGTPAPPAAPQPAQPSPSTSAQPALTDGQAKQPSPPVANSPSPPADAKDAKKLPTRASEELRGDIEVVNVDTADALSRLRLLRIQMALDREEIAALDLRLEKLKRQRELEEVLSGSWGKVPAGPSVSATAEPGRRGRGALRSVSDELIIKAISLKPVKESIVWFRGRVYRLREGDRLGDLEVTNISDGGLTFRSDNGTTPRLGVGTVSAAPRH